MRAGYAKKTSIRASAIALSIQTEQNCDSFFGIRFAMRHKPWSPWQCTKTHIQGDQSTMVRMAIWTPCPRSVCLSAALVMFSIPLAASAQSINSNRTVLTASSSVAESGSASAFNSLALPINSSESSSADPAGSASPLPEAPEPAAFGAKEKYDVAPAATAYQEPFSRIGIGADINTMGIGIKSAIVLNHLYDARVNINFLSIDTGKFDIEGFNADVNAHFASAGASLDWYPFASVWRISPGVLFYNANHISVTSLVAPGNSFTLNGQTFYSASPNAVTGATPLTGTGVLGLNTTKPAFTIAGGFGKFIPRSNRHWSFPSEFGVAFTGAPSANITVSGWTCLDKAQTKCSDVTSKSNPVGADFNSALNGALTKWRRDLAKVQIYPLFSYSVVYSFDIR
jgi:hypothetical protein